MNKAIGDFDEITAAYDVVLLDTSVCRCPVDASKRERQQLLKRLGPGIIKNKPYQDIGEVLKYVYEITESVVRQPRIQTVPEVIEEIDIGLCGLGSILGRKKGRRKENLGTYLAAVKGLRNTLRSRIIRFTDEEMANLKMLEKALYSLKGNYNIHETDFKILVSAVNAATYRGDTALFTNDFGLLNAASEIADYPKMNPQNTGVVLHRHRLELYTSLSPKQFYRYY